MDLLRAVIVGPYGTPYQDGLFFFDFHLPPEYPDVPPVRNFILKLFCCPIYNAFPTKEREDMSMTFNLFVYI